MKQTHRLSFVAPLVVLACALVAGGLYTPGAAGISAASPDDDIRASLRTFSGVYAQVEQNYAEPLDADRAIYGGAIPGMLRTMDPHSGFFDPRSFQLMREEQRGHYFGLGMRVGPRENRTMVMEIFSGSPAQKAGLRPGDLLYTVNGKSTEGLSTSDVADLLKGPRGTTAKVWVRRPGRDQELGFDVVRDEINRKSVPEAFFYRPGIAYVQIAQFTDTTSRELDAGLRALGENNIRGLILDLRSNPGGLLNEGVAVSERFLQKGQTVVSHRGRASPEKRYVSRSSNPLRDYPIVVMVDRASASASEIVAGALQDHDRAWVIGDNTFGKGLVQTVYPLSENTGLALTTAKYYTPSDRLIQRDYSSMSFFDYYNRKDTGTQNQKDVKMTDSGRTVYGGGGIAPDEKYTPPRANRFQIELLRARAFFNFTASHFGAQVALKLPRSWTPDQAVENEFHRYLIEQGVTFTEAEYAENQSWVRTQLRLAGHAYAFSVENANRIAIESDPAVVAAVESLPKAKALLENAKKLLAQRSAKRD